MMKAITAPIQQASLRKYVASQFAAAIALAAALPFTASPVHAAEGGTSSGDQICYNTPEGRICKQRQAIAGGIAMTADDERGMGLVTVNGGCSGTLLNRNWVLTARHCVTTDGKIFGPLAAPGNIRITARWAAGVSVAAEDFVTLHTATNTIAPVPTHDIVLVMLSSGQLEARRTNYPYVQQPSVYNPPRSWIPLRVENRDVVTQYGRGLQSLASGQIAPGQPAPVLGMNSPGYNKAEFAPTNITSDGYDFNFTSTGAVGHGGDSGGPGFIASSPYIFITGVQSTCRATYIPGAPIAPGQTSPSWQYANKISSCHYVSVEPFAQQIGEALTRLPKYARDEAAAKAAAKAAAAARPRSVLALRTTVSGNWTIASPTGGVYRFQMAAAGAGIDPFGRDNLPIPVTGSFTNIMGASESDGGFQGVLQPNRMMTLNYFRKSGSTGTCQFIYATDGQELNGDCVDNRGNPFKWSGRRQ